MKATVRPWLASAESVSYTGQLMYFDVISRCGDYDTWALYPAGPYHMGVEVDIRACKATAGELQEQQVIIEGKLIQRGLEHTPLLVAERIVPARRPFPLASLSPRQ